jgi:prepilin-type N-terminal cleavage/methylation domain-containing protein
MKSNKHAFTLIEIVAVISMLGVMLLLIAATLWGAVRVERADAAAFHRMTVQAQLADQFRDDVHRATACADAFRELSASTTCLILKLNEDRHVAYRWTDERLTRTEFVGAEEMSLYVPTGDRVTVEFGRPDAGPPIVWMRLLESRGAGSSRCTWPVEIRAAVGANSL